MDNNKKKKFLYLISTDQEIDKDELKKIVKNEFVLRKVAFGKHGVSTEDEEILFDEIEARVENY